MASHTARKSETKRTGTNVSSVAGKSLAATSKKLTPIVKVAATKTAPVRPTAKRNAPKVQMNTKAKTKSADNAMAPKVKKTKLVRDSFTIPKDEYLALQRLKERAIGLTKPTKKGELLRAGLLALANMSDSVFLATLAAIPALKTGRPKGVKTSKK
jgi:hypothetical protein